MSNHNDLTTIHHTLQDIDRQVKKNASQMHWILILVIISLVLSLISVLLAAVK